MASGWRRAFCTTFDPSEDHSDSPEHISTPDSPSPRNCVKLGFFSGSNSSTPRSLSLFKNSFKFRSSCGICLESVKTGQGTAIYTAECGHAFHFPCVTGRASNNNLCPVCSATWHHLPLLSPHYDDDEPLPEDNVEFQGFFVTPNKDVELKLLPESALISVGRSHETYAAVLRVKAPKPILHRAPIDLVAVLDLTCSSLQMLKRAVTFLISSLGSADRLSLLANTNRLLPLRRMTPDGKRAARLLTDRLLTTQAIAEGAIKKATKVLQDRREKNPVGAILLLSDDGIQKRTCHVSSSCNFTLIGIPVHSEEAVAKHVGGVLSLVVQDLRVRLSLSPTAEITAVYSFNGLVLDPTSVNLGDLHAGEDRELLMELRVPPIGVGAHHVMSVAASYTHPATQQTHRCKQQNLIVQVGVSAPKMERLRNLFIATRAIAESRRLMGMGGGDYSTAYRLLASARALIAGDEFARDVEAEMAEMRRQVEEQRAARWIEKEVTDEPLTPMSAWRAAEKLAKVAMSFNKVTDLHGFESARF